MKTMKRILVFLTAALLVLSLASCGDKSGSIKKAFEGEGYTVTTVDTSNSIVKGLLDAVLNDDQMDDLSKYELILCTKGFDNAVIIKFPNSGDLKDFLTVEDKDGNKNTALYDEAKDDGKINGNCLLIVGSSTAKDIFN